MKKSVAMLVINPCINDARVIKQAEALALDGYTVRVFCIEPSPELGNTYANGVTYIRNKYGLGPLTV